MIRSASFPHALDAPVWSAEVAGIFGRHEAEIGTVGRVEPLTGAEVLAVLAGDLRRAGFQIERRERTDRKGERPAFFSGRARTDAGHFIDVYHPEWLCCLAIEGAHPRARGAGDLVEPLLVVDFDTLCFAVPIVSVSESDDSKEEAGRSYDRAHDLASAAYGHIRVPLPYRLLLIGY